MTTFKPGDRVEVNTDLGWIPGEVVALWHHGSVRPQFYAVRMPGMMPSEVVVSASGVRPLPAADRANEPNVVETQLKYVILTDIYSHHLEEKVNEQLAAGWELLGGVSVAVKDSGDTERYAQAMIRRGPPDRPPAAVPLPRPVSRLGVRPPPRTRSSEPT